MITRKTKIVCSMGPTTANDEIVEKLIKAGMNVARFNFSHGDHETHKIAMERVRRVSEKLQTPVALLLDTKGPEIRTGNVENDGLIKFEVGDKVIITVDGATCTQGNEKSPTHLSLSWKDLPNRASQGIKILIADGLIELEVNNVENQTVYCTAKNSGSIGSKKNVNIIGLHAGLPIMTDQDKADIAFGVSQNVDFIAASFVSFPEEIVEIKEYLKSLNSTAKIIAKIENKEGLDNIAAIVKEADGVMVARGDLGVQLPTEKIPLAQKAIIRTCRQAGKPVITATQMLDSMIVNPRPTRAELTDVSNAVFDGTDAVMLSGETANGKYPVESVRTMDLITSTTEASEEYLTRMKEADSFYKPNQEIGRVVTHSAYKLARNIDA
jgi:pyruvate kinase